MTFMHPPGFDVSETVLEALVMWHFIIGFVAFFLLWITLYIWVEWEDYTKHNMGSDGIIVVLAPIVLFPACMLWLPVCAVELLYRVIFKKTLFNW